MLRLTPRGAGPSRRVFRLSMAMRCVLLLGCLILPVQAQYPVTSQDHLADGDAEAGTDIRAIPSGSAAERTPCAVEASRRPQAPGECDALADPPGRTGSDALQDAELGHVWFERGNHVVADLHFRTALDGGHQPDAPTRRRMVIAAYMTGENLHYAREDFPGAIGAYTRALALDPDHVPALLGRAEALRHLDRHAEALADLDRAIGLGANWPAHLLRARTRLTLDDVPGAIADFRQVLHENPRHSGARQALSDIAAGP